MTDALNVSWTAGDQREPILLGQLPTVYNKTMTDGVEVSQVLPRNTKRFTIQCRTAAAFQLNYVTGADTTYTTVKASAVYTEENVNSSGTLFLYQNTGGDTIAEIVCWS
jgi:hypothetical protein